MHKYLAVPPTSVLSSHTRRMELARRPHAPPSVLDTQMAHDLGFSRHAIAHRVERGHWKRLVRGVYLTHSGVPTRDEWIRAALLWGGPDAVLAGLPALRLHGLRFDFSDTPIVLLVTRGSTRLSSGRVVVRHTTRLPKPRVVSGHPVASPARALVEACLLITDLNTTRELVATVVEDGFSTVTMIGHELAEAPSHGGALLRRVLMEIAAGAESVPECEIAELFQRAGVSGFTQNTRLYDRAGRQIGRGDVVWEELRAVLEIDGQAWHFRPEPWRRTLRRHNRLELAGYAVLHYPPAEIRRDPVGFVAEVREWLNDRARQLAG